MSFLVGIEGIKLVERLGELGGGGGQSTSALEGPMPPRGNPATLWTYLVELDT